MLCRVKSSFEVHERGNLSAQVMDVSLELRHGLVSGNFISDGVHEVGTTRIVPGAMHGPLCPTVVKTCRFDLPCSLSILLGMNCGIERQCKQQGLTYMYQYSREYGAFQPATRAFISSLSTLPQTLRPNLPAAAEGLA